MLIRYEYLQRGDDVFDRHGSPTGWNFRPFNREGASGKAVLIPFQLLFLNRGAVRIGVRHERDSLHFVDIDTILCLRLFIKNILGNLSSKFISKRCTDTGMRRKTSRHLR